MAKQITAVHVTHEATGKIGGIGAVLHGLFTCNRYLEAVERSILVGPLFTTEGSVSDRLGENSEVLYSSVDGLTDRECAAGFRVYHKGLAAYNPRAIEPHIPPGKYQNRAKRS